MADEEAVLAAGEGAEVLSVLNPDDCVDNGLLEAYDDDLASEVLPRACCVVTDGVFPANVDGDNLGALAVIEGKEAGLAAGLAGCAVEPSVDC